MSINHQNNFGTNLTSNTNAGDTTSPLNSIPTVDAPFYIAFDATNVNSHYEVLKCTSKTASNVNHAALTYNHTTAEEVRCVCPAEEMDTWSAALDTTTWADWTPTYANLTVGTGTVVAKYTQIGKTVHFYFYFLLGASSVIGSVPTISLPVTSVAYPPQTSIGNVVFHDETGSEYIGIAVAFSATVAGFWCVKSDSTYASFANVTATVPFAWASTDQISIIGTYEAA
jgi:hypothetical protein